MSRYIDADKLWKDTTTYFDYCEEYLELIEKQPTSDVVERKRGEWIQHVNEPSLWSCSICETVIYSEHQEDRLKFHKWCGCCGADMRGEEDDEIH